MKKLIVKKNSRISIIILNFNVRKLVINCLNSILSTKSSTDDWEIIVVDNDSNDGLKDKLKNLPVTFIENKKNLGFAKANNVGIKKVTGKYVLILNPDTVVYPNTINKVLMFLESNPEYGAATCRVELPDKTLDYSCHRGFPTPWNAFCYFSGLSKLFPDVKIFTGYTASSLNLKVTHEVDAITGAFMLVNRVAGDSIAWFDEDYFWNGEDLDFCYKLKERHWKIAFIPQVKITHFKGSSSGLKKTGKGNPNQETIKDAALSSTAVMRLFYSKHLAQKYPVVINYLVYVGIYFLERLRKIKTIY